MDFQQIKQPVFFKPVHEFCFAFTINFTYADTLGNHPLPDLSEEEDGGGGDDGDDDNNHDHAPSNMDNIQMPAEQSEQE